MTDTYDAVYSAVRSRISGGNIGEVIERVARKAFDMGNARMLLQEQIAVVGYEMARPSAIYRPSISVDGTKWRALYGDDLMNGVAGFGDTPAEAMAAFDKAWTQEKTPEAARRTPAKVEG